MSAIFPSNTSTHFEAHPLEAQPPAAVKVRIARFAERICEAYYRSAYVQRRVQDAIRRAAQARTHYGLDGDDILQ